MRRLRPFLLVLAVVGCNSILENEPGRLDDGTRASSSSSGGASSSGSTSSDTDPTEAQPTQPISEDEPATNDAGTGARADSGPAGCSTGTKACGELCVSTLDPFFGCADVSCARCDLANATAACGPTGACAIGACVPGFADCNASPVDGCETSLQTVNDCGACGLKCPTLKNVEMACVGGACTGTCAVGFADCNGKPEDGCERDLMTDKRNCGACGTRCAVGRCEQGTCVWP